MNTQPYERHLDRSLEDQPQAPSAFEPESSAFATHRDPSFPAPNSLPTAAAERPSIAWVRPSELPTAIGSKWIRRGIDLQSELTRRARRSPGSAVRSAGRVSRTAIARPTPSAPTVDRGVEL